MGVAQYFSQKKQNQNALKHFKTAEDFAECSKTNVFIWEKISRVFFLPACSAILDCSKCHATRAESAIYTSYIYGLNPRPLAHNLSFVPAYHHVLHGKYVNLLYIYRLFLASAIYDCVPLYTAKGTVATEPYLLFNTILTIHHGIDHGYQPGLFNCNTILQCNTTVSRAYR